MHSQPSADDASVVKFRGATYDAAVEAAQKALGPRVKVLAADRIRRGGIGGFFATELGVEVTVAMHDETVDEALERLVAATDEEESSNWFEQLTSMTHSTDSATAPVTFAPSVSAPLTGPTLTGPSLTGPSMTGLLTARAVVGADTIVSRVAIDSPPPPTAEPVVDQVSVVFDQIRAHDRTAARTAPTQAPAPETPPVAATPQPAPTAPQPASARRRILLPTRGHVDLAVSAAAELARLTSEQLHGRRIAVHVVVTSDDGRSVEADAIIEDQS
ncbi:MAG TPA: hypothetical protein VFV63_11685 [Ilumatobacteraceae bacterium]|nr:hypothetical protein [Ilumatobacteraceae bacterium]